MCEGNKVTRRDNIRDSETKGSETMIKRKDKFKEINFSSYKIVCVFFRAFKDTQPILSGLRVLASSV